MTTKTLTTSIFQTLIHLSSKYGKKYCYPSQDKIVDLLSKFYNVEISRRSLNRWLRYLEDEGYFERRRRITKGDDGRFHFRSTIYILKGKLFKMAHRFGQLLGNIPFWKYGIAGHGADHDNDGPKKRQSRRKFLAGIKTVKAAIAGD